MRIDKAKPREADHKLFKKREVNTTKLGTHIFAKEFQKKFPLATHITSKNLVTKKA
jgi:hypothetical protein